MPAILIPGRAATGQRPSGPFQVNRDSAQSHDLALWWPILPFGGVSMGRSPLEANHATAIGSTVRLQGGTLGGLVMRATGASVTTDLLQTTSLQNGPSNFTSPFTISCWAWFATLSNDPCPISMGGSATFKAAAIIGRSSVLRYEGRGPLMVTGPSIVAGGWYHICGVTYGASSHALFVNGVKYVGTGTNDSGVPDRFSLGIYDDGSSFNPTDGLLCDGRIYNRALSDAEVWSLYDPATRWDLYWVPGRRVFVDVAAAATFNPAWARGSNQLLSGGFVS
jgi:hypothetical protein